MKNTRYIFIFVLGALLCSCVQDANDSSQQETRGVMQIEILEKDALPEDKMETIRFIVFKNASSFPALELNELFVIPDVAPGEDEVSRISVILEVNMRPGVNDKMVVAIANEPTSLKNRLDELWGYGELSEMELSFSDFLTNDHHGLQNGKTMPMTGVAWTAKVYPTPEQAAADPVKIELQRAAAKVEIYMKKEDGQDFGIDIGTQVALRNTYDRSYLLLHSQDGNTFGKLQTLTSGFVTKSWIFSPADPAELPTASDNPQGRLVCSFYTPERTCSAINNVDKLLLSLQVTTTEGVSRFGELLIDRFYLNGAETSIDIIRRNNNYRVNVTVESNSISATVGEWKDEEIEIEF